MPISRRDLLSGACGLGSPSGGEAIDRRSLVRRHNPVLRAFDPRSPLSAGNGEIAFTLDPTGLQTFPESYESGIPLCTQSQWGWHSFPAPKGLGPADLRLEPYDTFGRPVGYPTRADGQKELFNWLRENPHRLHLGRIALELRTAAGAPARQEDIREIEQTLDLWTGVIESRFTFDGAPVHVRTCCHPGDDCIAAEIESPLAARKQLGVSFRFPYGSPAVNAADWKPESRHRTRVTGESAGRLELARELDGDRYFVSIAGSGTIRRAGDHHFDLTAPSGKMSFAARFSARPASPAPDDAFPKSARHWSGFWGTGAAIDLSGSADPRARELERRIVLSQYLTAIQCSGSMPPQETGLTCNSWYGKFHLEMHWWHAAHFPLWGRAELLERSLGWYASILETARDTARRQGYAGARWPKMAGPEGRDSPSNIGPLLIWQQPHVIAMAELCHQANPGRAVLDRYRTLVNDSAVFMASYAHWDGKRYVLGPPVIPAQENHPPRETWNPTFELVYWKHALGIAQQWRERLGMRREPKWDDVRAKLAALPVKDGVYLAHENCPQTFTERNRDHPSMLGALGVLPGEGVDREVMRATLRKVMREWRWADTWGWDFPMVAMTAARLGEPGTAIDALFADSPKNTWLANGHNPQRANLPLYLPANGGLLAATAMMASKWQGFPKQGWNVRWEGLRGLL